LLVLGWISAQTNECKNTQKHLNLNTTVYPYIVSRFTVEPNIRPIDEILQGNSLVLFRFTKQVGGNSFLAKRTAEMLIKIGIVATVTVGGMDAVVEPSGTSLWRVTGETMSIDA
jgi:hypothetical protein